MAEPVVPEGIEGIEGIEWRLSRVWPAVYRKRAEHVWAEPDPQLP
jgi:hypothetical protein